MKTTGILAGAAIFAAGLCAAGCTADATSGPGAPEDVGVSMQKLSGLIIDTWGGVGNASGTGFTNGASSALDLGVGGGWTCWVAGVGGQLGPPPPGSGVGNVWVSQGSPTSDWILTVNADPGAAVIGTAVCAPSTNLGTTDMFPDETADPETILTSASINTWCGISGIFTENSVWNTASSVATVSNNGSNPEISPGAATWTVRGTGANVSATCASSTVTGIWFYDIVAPSSGTASFNLLQNGGAPLPSGTACFLTNVKGAFTNNSFSDGVFINLSSSGVWSLKATNGKSAWALCIH